MTIITCEHCGPTRVAPHDINCPTRQPQHFDEADDGDPTPYHEGVDFMHYQLLKHPWPVQPAPAIREPIAYSVTHQTVPNEATKKPMCVCGYDPGINHPDASPGQLFAYVGQHIREHRP